LPDRRRAGGRLTTALVLVISYAPDPCFRRGPRNTRKNRVMKNSKMNLTHPIYFPCFPCVPWAISACGIE
jgi:hypothetical protein